MSSATVEPTILIESQYEVVKSVLGAFLPSSFESRRDRAITAFRKRGLPSTRDEEFKYLPLHALHEGGFNVAYGATVNREDFKDSLANTLDGVTVAFVNGQHAPELSTLQSFDNGAFVGSLEEAFPLFEALISENLGSVASLEGKLGTTNDERFAQLNLGFLSEGAFVYVPAGVQLEEPIQLTFISKADHGKFACHPRCLIILERGASAKVVESYLGLQGTYFVNAVTEIVLGEGASLEHTKCQTETEGSIHIATQATRQKADSVFTACNINFGGKTVRNDVNVSLEGEHTETWLNGIAVGFAEQIIDNHTRIDHAKPNCNSFEIYKSILGDKSVGIFNGKIFVYEDAQKTDAKQTNQAILLSPTATINTKPQLEIFADDVKCTHGATVGQLREEALFYLRARGIPHAEAQAILVYAFAAEVLEKITVRPLREALETALYEKLGALNAVGPR